MADSTAAPKLNAFQARVRDRLNQLGLNAFEVARAGGFERSFVHDILSGKKASVRGDSLGRLAAALDWPVETLVGGRAEPRRPPVELPADVVLPRPGEEAPGPRFSGNRDVEVRGISIGGSGDDNADFSFNGQVIDYAQRPPGLVSRRGVFMVHAVNDSMVPAIQPGDPLFIDSHREASPGEDVIVELVSEIEGEPGPAFIKRLVRRSGSKYIVHQFNPDRDIEFDRDRVKKLWRVIPLRELLGL